MTSYSTSRHRPTARGTAIAVATAIALLGACGEDRSAQPPSLDSPRDLATATRSDCGDANRLLRTFNDSGDRCSIGLIANADDDQVAIADFGRTNPTLVDLDPTVPGTTHLPVGRNPVDVETSPDGTSGYTLNAVDNNLTVLDLWTLERTDTTIPLPAPARTIATAPGPERGGSLIAALDDPSQLWIRPGVYCNRPDSEDPGCSNLEADGETAAIELPGRTADLAVGSAGERAYLVYQNRNFMSVFALPDERPLSERDRTCRGNRTEAPCEIRRVGLTHGCSDGIDTDGDGAADRNDPQCWGPTGAESPDGIGRTPTSACNDGVDNDGDGQVDRSDPDCQSAADDSERRLLAPEAEFPCDNGIDDDGDGATDFPEDSSCYGPRGRRESAIESKGFETVAVDRMGAFVYVVDRADAQVLAVDARRLELVDAPAAAEPSVAAFNDELGVRVGQRPAAAAGFLDREILWTDPDDPSHGIVRYSFGAYVASDDGRTYFVEAVDAECEVREPDRDELLSDREFALDSPAFRNSAERSCLDLPEFPLERSEETVEACEQRRACLECLDGSGSADCDAKCEDFDSNDLGCRGAGREFQPSMQTRSVVNPVFARRDANTASGRIAGRGRCTAPEFYEDRLRSFVDDVPGAPENFTCDSPLRPQPVTSSAEPSSLEGESLDSVPRARLLREISARLRPPSGDRNSVSVGFSTRIFDLRLREESWRVTWEGVLPGTDRRDGLFAEQTREIERGGSSETVVDLDVGDVDLCSTGVRAGDRLIVRSAPATGDDAPDRCSELTVDDRGGPEDARAPDNRDPFSTFRIVSVRADTATIAPISEPSDGREYAQRLPTRACFRSGVEYQIRAEDTWIVQGESTGFVSERTSELGRCVDRDDDGSGRLGGRVETGGLFVGPYLSFEIFEGFDSSAPTDISLAPVRRPGSEFQYQFSVQRFFQTDTFGTNTVLPADALLARDVNRGAKLLVADANDDFVWLFNFGKSRNRAIVLQ